MFLGLILYHKIPIIQFIRSLKIWPRRMEKVFLPATAFFCPCPPPLHSVISYLTFFKWWLSSNSIYHHFMDIFKIIRHDQSVMMIITSVDVLKGHMMFNVLNSPLACLVWMYCQKCKIFTFTVYNIAHSIVIYHLVEKSIIF